MSNIKVKTQEELDQAYFNELKKFGFQSVEEIKDAILSEKLISKPDADHRIIHWFLNDGMRETHIFTEFREYKTSRFAKGVKRKRISFVKFKDDVANYEQSV